MPADTPTPALTLALTDPLGLTQCIIAAVADYRSPRLIAAARGSITRRVARNAHAIQNERQHNAARLHNKIHVVDPAHPFATAQTSEELLYRLSNQEMGSLAEAILHNHLDGRTTAEGGLLRGDFHTSALADKDSYTHSDLLLHDGTPVDLKSTAKGNDGAPLVNVNQAEAASEKYAYLLISHTFTDRQGDGQTYTLYFVAKNPHTAPHGWVRRTGSSPYYQLNLRHLTAGWRNRILSPRQATSGINAHPWVPN